MVAGVAVVVVVAGVVVRLMDKILHDPKDPKLWELWYIPYYGSCRILSINRSIVVVVVVVGAESESGVGVGVESRIGSSSNSFELRTQRSPRPPSDRKGASRREPGTLHGCATIVASDPYHPTPSRRTLSMKDGKAMMISMIRNFSEIPERRMLCPSVQEHVAARGAP